MKVFAFIAIICGGFILGKLTIAGIKKLIKHGSLDDTNVHFAISCLRVFFQVSSLLLGLEVLGVNTTSVAAILGAFSFAAGLAMKNLFANAASGFVLVLFGHFKVGDEVELAGTKGIVKEINIFDTLLISEGSKIVLPNSSVLSEKQVITKK